MVMEAWEVKRAYDLYAYRLFQMAQEKGDPNLSGEEARDCLSKLDCAFPRDVKFKDIISPLERMDYIKISRFGIIVRACPYIPLKALGEGEEQRKWFKRAR